MLEYGIVSGLGDWVGNGLSGAFDALLRAGDELVDVAAEHPLIAIGIVVALVLLARSRPRRGG